MSSDFPAISARSLTKRYRIFDHPGDRLRQAMTLGMRSYHREFAALKDVSFNIVAGETVGIVGRNGSGKSTLLQLLCGILKPTSGNIGVKGRVSALLELGAGFNPEFTGRENVYFQGALLDLSRQQVDEHFDEIAAFADIGEFMDQPVQTYSSGMFVRLAFATMIHADADILVIDEALAVGDEAFQKKCFDWLAGFVESGDKILLFVSHNTRQVERICQRTIWLGHGRIMAQGESHEVCSAYQTHMNATLSDGQPPASRPIPNIADSGEVEVEELSILPDGEEAAATVLGFHDGATIRVRFRCKMPLVSPEIIIGFQTLDAVFIAAASTARLQDAPSFDAGEHLITCRIPEVSLLPGVYSLRLAFLDSNGRHIWIGHRLNVFSVKPTSKATGRGIPFGICDMPFEWGLRHGGDEQ